LPQAKFVIHHAPRGDRRPRLCGRPRPEHLQIRGGSRNLSAI